MKKPLIFIFLFLLAISALALAGASIQYFKVYNDANGNIKVEWRTTQESDVSLFILERKSDQTNWSKIKSFDPHGPGLYSFTDHPAYKTSDINFSYRLGVKSSSTNQITYIDQTSINYKVSGFKQTWGSIKAMFR